MSALCFTAKLATTAAVAAAVTVPAGAALADTRAPYAQAAAYVNANGTLQHGKNIISSHRASIGNYCVQVEDDVDLSNTVVQATSTTRAFLGAITTPTGTCGNRANTITVYSWAYNAAWMDSAFYLSVS